MRKYLKLVAAGMVIGSAAASTPNVGRSGHQEQVPVLYLPPELEADFVRCVTSLRVAELVTRWSRRTQQPQGPPQPRNQGAATQWPLPPGVPSQAWYDYSDEPPPPAHNPMAFGQFENILLELYNGRPNAQDVVPRVDVTSSDYGRQFRLIPQAGRFSWLLQVNTTQPPGIPTYVMFYNGDDPSRVVIEFGEHGDVNFSVTGLVALTYDPVTRHFEVQEEQLTNDLLLMIHTAYARPPSENGYWTMPAPGETPPFHLPPLNGPPQYPFPVGTLTLLPGILPDSTGNDGDQELPSPPADRVMTPEQCTTILEDLCAGRRRVEDMREATLTFFADSTHTIRGNSGLYNHLFLVQLYQNNAVSFSAAIHNADDVTQAVIGIDDRGVTRFYEGNLEAISCRPSFGQAGGQNGRAGIDDGGAVAFLREFIRAISQT
ncbi:MAG: hypothetical protein LBJ69_00645 [Holosporales bacterium]|nr:hypothetical protein [Holosporales bacterium]